MKYQAGSFAGDLDSPRARAKAKADEERRAMTETAALEKLLKNRLAAAAEHFNRDYKKGFLYLQVETSSFILMLHRFLH